MSGTAAWSTTAETPLARASLNRWPSRPNPVTSVAHLIPAASACRLASAFSVVITPTAAALTWPVCLAPGIEHPRADRLGQAERQARLPGVNPQQRGRIRGAGHRHAVLRLRIIDAVAAGYVP
jgi:hypothetical protein